MSKKSDPADTPDAAPPARGFDFDRELEISRQKAEGILYESDDPRFVDPSGRPWRIQLANPRSPDVNRLSQKLERDWRKRNHYKAKHTTPVLDRARLSAQAAVLRAAVHLRYGWHRDEKTVTFDTFSAPETLQAARKALKDAMEVIEPINDFVGEAIMAWNDHGDEEQEGEG